MEVWAYCLMPNHVHLILTPRDEDGLRAALGETHRRYTSRVNHREGWLGYLWQGRFASAPMDESHLLACARYVELNPVRAKLVRQAQDWPWSSAVAHLTGRGDGLVRTQPLLDRVERWAEFLDLGLDALSHAAFQAAERTGRPLGAREFIADLERQSGRTLIKRKPGPRPSSN